MITLENLALCRHTSKNYERSATFVHPRALHFHCYPLHLRTSFAVEFLHHKFANWFKAHLFRSLDSQSLK